MAQVTPENFTADLVATARTINYESLPGDVIATVKRVLIDTLAVAWAAGGAAGVEAAVTLALRGRHGRATLWSRPHYRRTASAAAFANATLASALDFDSLAGTLHADIVVAPAALAVAEEERRSGSELVAALALGNELTIRLGAATSTGKGWFLTSIYGVFGAALAAARLRGLDDQATAHALGIALCRAGGTMQSHIEQRLTKRLQSAFAAQDGVVAAELASLGITGPSAVFEGRFGLFSLFENGDLARVRHGFGSRYLLTETALKRFPACGCSHAVLQAAVDIVEQSGVTAAELVEGEIVITPYMNRLVGGAFAPEANPQVTGQFNARYGVASVLLRGHFDLTDIEPAAVLDPAIWPIVDRLRVRVDESRTGSYAPSDLTLVTVDGRRLHRRVDALPGSIDAPLSADEIHRKLIHSFGHGPNALGERRAAALIEAVERIEALNDVSTLLDVIR